MTIPFTIFFSVIVISNLFAHAMTFLPGIIGITFLVSMFYVVNHPKSAQFLFSKFSPSQFFEVLKSNFASKTKEEKTDPVSTLEGETEVNPYTVPH